MSHAPKVWVCKYVGKPGVDEVLKSGKNPITVSSNATVGTYFKDAQGRSFVLALQTHANTGHGNQYIGEAQCPTPTDETTTTTTPDPVTTTTIKEGETSTTIPSPSTTGGSTTTVSTKPPTSSTSTLVPGAPTRPAPGVTTSQVTHAPTLPFTGADTLPLSGVGLALVICGVLLARKR